MHVTMNSGDVAYVRLDCPEYADHHADRPYRLNARERKDLQARMDKVWGRRFIQSHAPDAIEPATGHEAAVDIWPETYGGDGFFDFNKDGYHAPIDYTDLP